MPLYVHSGTLDGKPAFYVSDSPHDSGGISVTELYGRQDGEGLPRAVMKHLKLGVDWGAGVSLRESAHAGWIGNYDEPAVPVVAEIPQGNGEISERVQNALRSGLSGLGFKVVESQLKGGDRNV